MNPENIYEFRITLKRIKPKIWRKIQVPDNYTFYDLHVAITDAMGWKDYHLHKFEVFDPKTGGKVFIEGPGAVGFDDYEFILDNKAKISEYFLSPKDKALYEYDFGDGWEHDVVLEKILPAESGTEYPRCIAGRRACPPEDCGGPWGYGELLETIKNPNSPEYEEMMEWLGGSFDSEKFEPGEVYFDDPKERFKMVV